MLIGLAGRNLDDALADDVANVGRHDNPHKPAVPLLQKMWVA
jgi:hypothetical protein